MSAHQLLYINQFPDSLMILTNHIRELNAFPRPHWTVDMVHAVAVPLIKDLPTRKSIHD